MKRRKHGNRSPGNPASTPGNSGNALKIGIGVAAILVLGVVLFVLTQMDGGSNVQATGETQTIRMRVDGIDYVPSAFTVPSGSKVKWIIDGSDAVGCTAYILAPELGVSKRIVPGENVVEFTAPRPGSYTFTCGMGMVGGTINVV